MIYTTDVICQDQLNVSQHDGYVTVRYPADAQTVLSIQPDGTVQTRGVGTDGPYEQALVLSNGSLLYRPAGTKGFVVLGASLKPL